MRRSPAATVFRPRPCCRARARARASRAGPGCARAARRRASGSPCTTKVWRGAAWKAPSQRRMPSRSAWPEKPSMWLTSARTGTYSPWILTSGAPAISRAPRVPATWKPGNTMWLRASGAIASRCFRTRPPVAMPLAEMMMRGQRERASCRDCSALCTSVTRSTSVLASAGVMRNSLRWRRYRAVAASAMGLSKMTCKSRGMAPARRRRCSTSNRACARPTANDGSSTLPTRSAVARTIAPRRAWTSSGACTRLP